MSKIVSVNARQIFDSRGNPTVECDITTSDGLFRAAVPSGASTGVYEGGRFCHREREGESNARNGAGNWDRGKGGERRRGWKTGMTMVDAVCAL
eukprot:scaffold212216_cov26-Tisochrysis_lutea.AAC.1